MDNQELRKLLRDAKNEIEQKAGYKFNKDSVALADLISEFVSIKVKEALSSIQIPAEKSPVFGNPEPGKGIDDNLYGD